MKKLSSLFIVVLLFSFTMTTFAYEEVEKRFFGVGATVEEKSPGVFTVTTKGEKAGEGFVYTPRNSKGEINFQVDLKGKGTVYLKIEETDAGGRFLKEYSSEPMELTNEWKKYNLKATLNPNTSQVDLFVLNSTKEKMVFEFRNVKP